MTFSHSRSEPHGALSCICCWRCCNKCPTARLQFQNHSHLHTEKKKERKREICHFWHHLLDETLFQIQIPQQREGHFLFQHLKAQTYGLWSTHVHTLTLCSHLMYSSKCTAKSSFGWCRKFSYRAGSVFCSLSGSWEKNVPCCLTHEQYWQVMLQWTVQCFSLHRGELDRMMTTEVWHPKLQATNAGMFTVTST